MLFMTSYELIPFSFPSFLHCICALYLLHWYQSFSGFISSSFCLLLIAGRSVSFFSMSQSPFPPSYFYSYLWRRSWPLFSLCSFLLCSLFSVQFWRISDSVSTVSGRASLVTCYFSFTSAIRSQFSFFFSLVFLNVDHPCWSLDRLCFISDTPWLDA